MGQTTTAFFPRETCLCIDSTLVPFPRRGTTVNFDLATAAVAAAAVFLIRSRPDKRRERPFSRRASRRGSRMSETGWERLRFLSFALGFPRAP